MVSERHSIPVRRAVQQTQRFPRAISLVFSQTGPSKPTGRYAASRGENGFTHRLTSCCNCHRLQVIVGKYRWPSGNFVTPAVTRFARRSRSSPSRHKATVPSRTMSLRAKFICWLMLGSMAWTIGLDSGWHAASHQGTCCDLGNQRTAGDSGCCCGRDACCDVTPASGDGSSGLSQPCHICKLLGLAKLLTRETIADDVVQSVCQRIRLHGNQRLPSAPYRPTTARGPPVAI